MDRPSALLLYLAVLVSLATTALCLPRPRPSPLVTPEQYEKSLKMLRNVCQPKTGIPEEMLERMKGGEFVQDEKAFCYTACFLQTMMVLKNNKVDAKMFKLQVKKMMLPDDAARVTAAFSTCDGIASGANPCETTGLFINCVKKADPTFVVPA